MIRRRRRPGTPAPTTHCDSGCAVRKGKRRIAHFRLPARATFGSPRSFRSRAEYLEETGTHRCAMWCP
eukprot:6172215-Pyramimonas_sp.AAC.2